MRPSLRFLGLAIVGWVGLRTTVLGLAPGADLFKVSASEAKVPPLIATQFGPIEPIAPHDAASAALATEAAWPMQAPPTYSVPAVRPVVVPVYYPAAPPQSAALPIGPGMLPNPRSQFFSSGENYPEWPISRLASLSSPPFQSRVATPGQSTPADAPISGRPDRLQLSAWALLRQQSQTIAGSRSLAPGGSLGASQTGARLTYNFTRQIAASFRASSEVGRRGGEVAAGLRLQPLSGLPVWIDAERRQQVGRYGGGRSAFAVFAEGGLYQRPMPLGMLLDTYLQAGLVGARSRDYFIDGALTMTRPVYKQFSAGFGVWGGAQPGVARLDVGPRITMQVRRNIRVHADWRQRIAGKAVPGSGPAITLSGDF